MNYTRYLKLLATYIDSEIIIYISQGHYFVKNVFLEKFFYGIRFLLWSSIHFKKPAKNIVISRRKSYIRFILYRIMLLEAMTNLSIEGIIVTNSAQLSIWRLYLAQFSSLGKNMKKSAHIFFKAKVNSHCTYIAITCTNINSCTIFQFFAYCVFAELTKDMFGKYWCVIFSLWNLIF